MARRSLPRFRNPVPASIIAMRFVSVSDLQAGRVAAELLKTGITDGDGSPRTIKLELHKIVFMKLNPQPRAIFKFRRTATRSTGENLTMSVAKTYWTFVVRLQSRMKLKSNRLLGTESVTKSKASTHSDRSLRSHQTPAVANGDEPCPRLALGRCFASGGTQPLRCSLENQQRKEQLSYGIIRFDTRRS